MNNIETFERLESNVRMYCRDLPLVFDTAQGSRIRGEDGREYLDFFAAPAPDYGHNDPRMRDALIAYLSANGVTHALDLHTTTKRSSWKRSSATCSSHAAGTTRSSSPARPVPTPSRRR